MTISSNVRIAGPFAGAGAVGPFAFAFKVFQAADLVCTRIEVATTTTVILTYPADYSVSLNADQNANPGGTVTLTAALAVGYTLTITSNVDYLQPVDLQNQGGFYPEVHEDEFDRLTILIQQVKALITTPPQPVISDIVFGASWNGIIDVAPSKNAIYDMMQTQYLPVGTKMLFYQDVAPAGWTIDNTLDDKVLYITKGSAAGGQAGGGAHATGTWTQPNHKHTGPSHTHTTGDHTLTTNEIPAHNHSYNNIVAGVGLATGGDYATSSTTTGNMGGGLAHNHGATGAAGTGDTGDAATVNTWRPAAYCAIICTKN